MRIVLVGKTGSGKSSTGNTILGKETFRVDLSSESVTTESKRCYRNLGDRIITVIDTPGPFDTHSYNTGKEQIEKAIDPGVHVFLLVIRLGVRFSEEEKKTVEWFLETLGEEAQKHTIVLFTHGNVLKDRTIEEHLKEHSVLKEIIDKMAGYHVFENKNKDKTQVTELLKKIDNVVDKNGSQMYTKEMYSEVQRKRQQSTSKEYAGVTVAVGAAVLGAAGAAVAVAGAARGEVSVIAGAAAGAAFAMGVLALAWVKKTTEDKE